MELKKKKRKKARVLNTGKREQTKFNPHFKQGQMFNS